MGHWGREKCNLILVLQRMHIVTKCQADALAEQTGDAGDREALVSVSIL